LVDAVDRRSGCRNPIFCRKALDHPFDHPDDPTGSFWTRLEPTSPTPAALQRRFLETPGMIINDGDTLTVRLERRAYAPVLRKANLPAQTTVPWWDNRTLRHEFA
jgi:hypothetical protein